MRIDKLFVVGAMLLGAFAVSSCGDNDSYKADDPVGENNVTFQYYTDPVMKKTETTFDVVLNRHTTSGTLSVPLELVSVPEGWTVPETAEFAAGESLATITVTPSSDIAFNKDYHFDIRIPESYTNPYKQNDGEINTFIVTVVKEDYEPFATGTYTTGTYDDGGYFFSLVYSGLKWPVTIEYSSSLDIYRIKDMLQPVEGVGGYNFYFKWNKEKDENQSFTLCASDGSKATKLEAGFEYYSYGMVSCNWSAATNNPADYVDEANETGFGGYLASENMFVLPWTFTVSAGSIVDGNDFIRNIEFAE